MKDKAVNLRRLTVSEAIRFTKYRDTVKFPVLRIQGKWFEDAGFCPGDDVYLFIEDGIITLKLKGDNDHEAKAINLYDVLNP